VRKVVLQSLAAPTGLAPDPSLQGELEQLAADDPSGAVREAARDALRVLEGG
jgi:hypothetical protein